MNCSYISPWWGVRSTVTNRSPSTTAEGSFDRREFLASLGGAAGIVLAVPNGRATPSEPDHYSSIHEALDDLPPEGGIVYLTAGEYPIEKPVILGDGVTLQGAGRDATVLTPTRDLDVVSLQGTNAKLADLKIQDTDNVHTVSHGVTLDGAHQSILSDIVIAETANGLLADNNVAENGDVWENSLRSIHIRDTGGHGFKFQGEYHDNSHIDLFANNCGGDGFLWSTEGVDGGNKYTQCIGIACEMGFRIESAQELWFDEIIADSNTATGFLIEGGFDGRLFANQLWTSTNGNNGLEIRSRDNQAIEDVYVNQLYSWQNQNFGVLTHGSGHVSRVVVGMLSVHDNQVGARFAAESHDGIWIQWMHSRANSHIGLDGDGGEGVNISSSQVRDGVDMEANALQRWEDVGIAEAGKEHIPNASSWNRGEIVENVSDGTVWFKTISDGRFVQLG